MSKCESEYIGYCIECGLSCNEVEACSETMIFTDSYPKGWKDKSLKERYKIIEQKVYTSMSMHD